MVAFHDVGLLILPNYDSREKYSKKIGSLKYTSYIFSCCQC